MKIAVTYAADGSVFQHFGHTEAFKLYTVENGAIAASEVRSTEGAGHESLAVWLKDAGVDTLICGGIGGGAQQALMAVGIKWFGGVAGPADQAAAALAAGTLTYDPNAQCTNDHGQHDHGHAHQCGHHQ